MAWAAYTWTATIVDSPATAAVGDRNSAVLDGSGDAHLAYDDFNNADLKYAYWDGSQWAVEVVDSGDYVASGGNTSIDLDPAGTAHISYYQAGTCLDLKHARRNGPGDRSVESVDTGGSVGVYNSLQVDSTGRVHIAYYDVSNRHLKYALYASSAWTLQTVDAANYTGSFCCLGLDSADRPRIIYSDNASANLCLKCALWDGSSWASESISGGMSARLAVDASDNVHVAYLARAKKAVMCTVRSSSGWSAPQTVDAGANGAAPPAIAVGPDGRVQIAYVVGNYGNLKLAVQNGTSWDVETANDSGQVYNWVSLVVGANSDPQVTYWRYDLGNLWYTVTRGPLAVRWPR